MRDVKSQGIPQTSLQLLSDMMEKGEGEENTWHETYSEEGLPDAAIPCEFLCVSFLANPYQILLSYQHQVLPHHAHYLCKHYLDEDK